MDSIGLLAAWVGVISFLIAIVITVALNLIISPLESRWATTSPARAERRISRLQASLDAVQHPGNAYLADLVWLYGSMIVTLVAAVGVVVISIQILDLGPSLLAAVLPFNINAKLLTRVTGLLLFVCAYLFVFRLCYLGAQLRSKTLPRKAGFRQAALQEIAKLSHLVSASEKARLVNQ